MVGLVVDPLVVIRDVGFGHHQLSVRAITHSGAFDPALYLQRTNIVDDLPVAPLERELLKRHRRRDRLGRRKA
jgi:hypothetical protein